MFNEYLVHRVSYQTSATFISNNFLLTDMEALVQGDGTGGGGSIAPNAELCRIISGLLWTLDVVVVMVARPYEMIGIYLYDCGAAGGS